MTIKSPSILVVDDEPGNLAIMRSILQSIDDGVLLTDLQHRSLACNRRFGELFGIDPQEVVQGQVEGVLLEMVDFGNNVEDGLNSPTLWEHDLDTLQSCRTRCDEYFEGVV